MRGKYDAAVFDLFVELFERLPLAFVIGGKTLVVRGRLPITPPCTLAQP